MDGTTEWNAKQSAFGSCRLSAFAGRCYGGYLARASVGCAFGIGLELGARLRQAESTSAES
jgi:hypothetical protein